MNEHYPKLKALDQALARWYEEIKGVKGMDPLRRERLQHFFDLFVPIRDSLKASHPAFRDFPARVIETFQLSGNEHVEAPCLRQLHEDVRFARDLLEAEQQQSSPPPDLRREGIFFAGQEFDAVQWIGEIVSQATNEICLVDGFVDGTVLKILTSKKPKVAVSVLTKPKAGTPALLHEAQSFQSQYGSLAIRLSEAFHDRFLLLDGRDHYHLGASLNHLGNRTFMFSLIEEPEVVRSIKSKWSSEWASAKVFV